MHNPVQSSTRRAGKAWVWIVVAVAVLGGGGLALWLILSNKVSSDFDLVPRDAQMFATVRVADALETDQIKQLKAMLEQAAVPDIAKIFQQQSALEDQIGLKLSEVERVTFVMDDQEKVHMWFLVHTKKDIDKDKVVAFLNAKQEKTYEGKTYNWQDKTNLAFYLVNPRLAVIAPDKGMERCLDVAKNGPGSGPLKDALKLASKDKYHIVAGANVAKLLDMRDNRKGLKEKAEDEEGPRKKLALAALKLQTVSFAMRLDKDMDTEIVGEFENSDAAKDAVEGLEAEFDKLRAMLKENAENVPDAEPVISAFDKLKPVQSGSTVTLRVESGPMVLTGLMLPSVHKVRESASRAMAQDNFHNILDAVHNHVSGNNDRFPPSAICDQFGKPLLSWRVALLPEIEQNALYHQFKLNEPWDSPHNIKLLERMPKLYDLPNAPAPRPGYTFIQTFVGADTLYPKPGPSRFTMLNLTSLDGPSNTILLATGAKAVPWTAPEDIVVDQGPIKPKLKFDSRGCIVGVGDGSVRTIRRTISEKTLRALITPAGGEVIDDEDFGRRGRGEPGPERPQRLSPDPK